MKHFLISIALFLICLGATAQYFQDMNKKTEENDKIRKTPHFVFRAFPGFFWTSGYSLNLDTESSSSYNYGEYVSNTYVGPVLGGTALYRIGFFKPGISVEYFHGFNSYSSDYELDVNVDNYSGLRYNARLEFGGGYENTFGGAFEIGSMLPINYIGQSIKPPLTYSFEICYSGKVKSGLWIYVGWSIARMDVLNAYVSGSYYDDIFDETVTIVPKYYKSNVYSGQIKVGLEFNTNKKLVK